MNRVKLAGETTSASETVVKVLTAPSTLSWASPAENDRFKLTQDATLPEIVFELLTQDVSEYQWAWTIEWQAKASGLRERARTGKVLKTFSETGSFVSASNRWTVNFAGQVLGGKLTVTAGSGRNKIKRSVFIGGQNPSKEQVADYVATLKNVAGYEALLEQETRTKHFINFDDEPIVAFDQGYGITQMTNPAPDYEQIWNWKANLLGGSTLYQTKLREAMDALGVEGRSYTDDQLKLEVFSRWNGGSYHAWDQGTETWVRKPNILCDSSTSNIGWSMDNPKNMDKTESELHERDKNTYRVGPSGRGKNHPWIYSGVCYADHVSAQ
jgi:hypothetical protein